MKEVLIDQDIPKKIKHIQFGTMKPEQIWEASEIQVVQRDLYQMGVTPKQSVSFGCLDKRLGISDKTSVCETCGENLNDCVGHFGFVKLALPVFHIGYFKAIIQILQCICKSCSKVMLDYEDRAPFLRRLSRPLDNIQRHAVFKSVLDQCKKVVTCPHCGGTNGMVKKAGPLKIVHEKFRAKRKHEEKDSFVEQFSFAIESTPEIKTHLGKAFEDLHPLRVLEMFEKIPQEDIPILCMNSEFGSPDRLIWRCIPVPPACIRPSVSMSTENGSNEDDLTIKLAEIIYTNQVIQNSLQDGNTVQNVMDDWDFLQLQCAMLINSELPGIPPSMAGKPIRGLCQRLKGKQGRFRGNLSGKRVDFSSRTVISPDPNLSIEQVGVPVYVAKTLTFPERVFAHNMERLKQVVKNGPDIHPGANYVIQGKTGFKKFLKFGDRTLIADKLQIGDIVERHMHDGDVVLFNRQPSLHRLSIMAHYAVIRPWRTFRFNECVCAPYNADFDGDEMNLHLPQTEEARAEAMQLMGVKHNLVTPRNGQPIIAATQDFITASYLITNKDIFYDKTNFCMICCYFTNASEKIDIPPPAILKPQRLWTGKQIIKVLLKPNDDTKVFVNVEGKGRTFSKSAIPDMCPNDGYLIIRNSELLCGTLDKAHVGDGNKGSLFYTILKDYGPDLTVVCMNRLARLCARWLANRGFSIGINDVQPDAELQRQKEILVNDGYSACDSHIEEFKAGKLPTQAGCTAEQTLEAVISGILSKIRDDVGQICLQELSKYNAPLIMQWCGSKGSKINVSQMVACVGQQIISGQRIPDGFEDRSLPHFAPNSKIPAAKGFVKNSFFSGLSPTEFFFHAVSGREGLVDTAVKTAETGYMQRRLMKALEDLSTTYDMSVRNSVQGIVQFRYGDDGLDPAAMEGDNQPVNFHRNLLHCKNLYERSLEPGLDVNEIQLITQQMLESSQVKETCSAGFIENVSVFINNNVIEPMKKALDSFDSHVVIEKTHKLTEKQLKAFLSVCFSKYMKSIIEPGTAVGALGGQSLGEPATQMTLKTFHFAGVASMNITLGVPRIKEIINASKSISTPIITAKLVNDTSVASARIVKGRIEKTTLGDIAEYIDEIYTATDSYLLIKIDFAAISALQLEIDLFTIQQSIAYAPKMKLSNQQVLIQKPDKIKVFPIQSKDSSIYFSIQHLKRNLASVIVKGIPTIHRAVINDLNDNTYNLLVEGHGLRHVMTMEGVVGTRTTCNDIIEIEKVLGIEAARSCIIHEIDYTMSKHGMTIDARHVMLLGDIMTFKGEVLGITRFGISKMKDSVLMLASFEKTTDHLFDAAVFSKKDSIDGVSECIIMGIPMPVGTGSFKVLNDVVIEKKGMKSLWFDVDEYH